MLFKCVILGSLKLRTYSSCPLHISYDADRRQMAFPSQLSFLSQLGTCQ